jgi:hypothetical protein
MAASSVLLAPEFLHRDGLPERSTEFLLRDGGIDEGAPLNTAPLSPDVGIVQYGVPRSASTFQWTLLCLIARMKATPGTPVDCYYQETDRPVESVGPRTVVKTHVPPIHGGPFHVFASIRSGHDGWPTAVYTQSLEHMSDNPLSEVSRYEPVFSLTPAQTQLLREYLGLWSTLRQCCGRGQSLANRQRLHGCPITATHHPGCASRNLTDVEVRLTRTQLFVHGTGDYAADQFAVGRCAAWERRIRAGEEWPHGTWFTTCEALRGD